MSYKTNFAVNECTIILTLYYSATINIKDHIEHFSMLELAHIGSITLSTINHKEQP